MKKLRKITASILLGAMLLSLAACGGKPTSGAAASGAGATDSGAATETLHIRFAHDGSTGGTEDKFVKQFKKIIEEKSEGAITVEVFTGSELGEGVNMVETLQMGGVDFMVGGVSALTTTIKELNVFSLPFVFPIDQGLEKNYELLNNGKMREYMEPFYEKQGLVLLQYINESDTYWTGNKLLKTPDDFKGFKMRVMASPLLQATYLAYGGAPTTVAWSELYSGLQLGMADGQTNTIGSCVRNKFNEVQSCATIPYSDYYACHTMATKGWWDSVSDAQKEMILECLDEMAYWHFDAYRAEEAEAEAIWTADGGEIYILNDDERAVFAELAKSVHQEYVDLVGPNGQEILDLVAADIAAMG